MQIQYELDTFQRKSKVKRSPCSEIGVDYNERGGCRRETDCEATVSKAALSFPKVGENFDIDPFSFHIPNDIRSRIALPPLSSVRLSLGHSSVWSALWRPAAPCPSVWPTGRPLSRGRLNVDLKPHVVCYRMSEHH